MKSDIPADKILRGNLIYQQRQQQRQNYLEKKCTQRLIFQLGRLMEKIQFEEELAVICGLLLDAKEKLQSVDTENIRQFWRIKGDGLSKEKF